MALDHMGGDCFVELVFGGAKHKVKTGVAHILLPALAKIVRERGTLLYGSGMQKPKREQGGPPVDGIVGMWND
jgi:hypothetical protein